LIRSLINIRRIFQIF